MKCDIWSFLASFFICHKTIAQNFHYWYGTACVTVSNKITKLKKLIFANCIQTVYLQCFDAVGWAAGRASGLYNTEWWGAGVVICLERGVDLHMAQLMPLPLTVSCFSKIQTGFAFLVPAHPGSPGQRAVKWVCVCVYKLNINETISRHTQNVNFYQLPIHHSHTNNKATKMHITAEHIQSTVTRQSVVTRQC